MRTLLLALLALPCLLGAITEQNLADHYGSAGSAISSRAAGALLLELVNAERAKHELSQLALSRSASRLARQHADDMAAHGYVGHYDLQGRKCELRYNLLGETDHVAENIAFREVGARVRLTPQLVRGLFADLLASKSHRANILHPAHTHMGYGFATRYVDAHTQIYCVQEFLNDWGGYSQLPTTVATGTQLELSGTVDPGVTLLNVSLAWETPPGPRTPASVGAGDLRYRQPRPKIEFLGPFMSNHYSKVAPLFPEGTPEMIRDKLIIDDGGEFHLSFATPTVDRPKDLYVTVWLRREIPSEDIPAFIAGFNDSSENAAKSEFPTLHHPFRVMTQVIRVLPN